MKDRNLKMLQDAMPQIFGPVEARITRGANRLTMAALLEAFDNMPPPTAEEALAMARYLSGATKGGKPF